MSDAVTSPSPPPLPKEPLPGAPVDVPIAQLGEDEDESESASEKADEDENEEEGEDFEKSEGDAVTSSSKKLGKRKAREDSGDNDGGEEEDHEDNNEKEADTADAGEKAHSWQAVWAPEQNAYYFWNSETGEVTWTNPLAPPPTDVASAPAPPLPAGGPPPLPLGPPPPRGSSSSMRPNALPDIDPALAFLLPPEQRGGSGADGGAGQTAMFNARSGRFATADNTYSVDHLDEYNRAKRMSSHYFDMDAWERQKAEEHAKRKREEEAGISHSQRITKKDMDRFRRKAAEKKHRSQAWLRD